MGLALRAQDSASSSRVRPGKQLQGEVRCPGNWQLARGTYQYPETQIQLRYLTWHCLLLYGRAVLGINSVKITLLWGCHVKNIHGYMYVIHMSDYWRTMHSLAVSTFLCFFWSLWLWATINLFFTIQKTVKTYWIRHLYFAMSLWELTQDVWRIWKSLC